jgi:phospholipase/lecithinase/hemolysin
MTVTDKQLKNRARQLEAAEAKRYQAMTLRDALIIQAVHEGRTKAEVAALVGVTKARVGKIVAEGIGADG